MIIRMVPSTASGSTPSTASGETKGESSSDNGATSSTASTAAPASLAAVSVTPQVITYTIPTTVAVGSSLAVTTAMNTPSTASSSISFTSNKTSAPASYSPLVIGVASQPPMTAAAVQFVPAAPANKSGDILVAHPRSSQAVNLTASVGGGVIGTPLSHVGQVATAHVNHANPVLTHKPTIAVSAFPVKVGAPASPHQPHPPASPALASPSRTFIKPLTKTLTSATLPIGSTLLTGKQFQAATGATPSEHHLVAVKPNSLGHPPILLSPTPPGALAPAAQPVAAPSPIAVPLNYSATSSRATLNVVATSQSPLPFPLQLTSSKSVTSSPYALNASMGQKISVQPNIMQKPSSLPRTSSENHAPHPHPHSRKPIELNSVAYSTILSATTPLTLSTTTPSTPPSLVGSSTSSIVRSPGGLVTSIPLSIVQSHRISSLPQFYASQESSAASASVPTHVIQRTPPLSIKTIPPSSLSAATLPVVRALPIKSHPASGLVAAAAAAPLLSPPGAAPLAINNNNKSGESLSSKPPHQPHHPSQQISILSSPPFPVTPLTPATLRHSSPVSYTLPAASVTVKPSQPTSHLTHVSPRRGGGGGARDSGVDSKAHHHPPTPQREVVCYGIPHQVYLVSGSKRKEFFF